MKKIFAALTLGIGLALPSFAQQDGDLTSAILALRNGDLKTAKSYIDKAYLKTKINTKPKVWRYRAEIYDRLMIEASNEKNPVIKPLLGDSGALVMNNALKMVRLLDKPGEEHFDAAKRLEGNLRVHLNNEGVRLYDEKSFVAAFRNFSGMIDLTPKDTNAYNNPILTAIEMQRPDLISETIARMKSNLTVPVSTYRSVTRYYYRTFQEAKGTGNEAQAKANYEKSLSEASSAYPSEKEFAINQLNLLLADNRSNEAKAKLEENIKLDPNNKVLYFILGNLFEQESKKEKLPKMEARKLQYQALDQYNKALKVDPTYTDANYNAGVVYVTMANPAIDSLNNLPLKAPVGLADKLNKRIDGHYKNALPYFEASYKADSKNTTVITILGKIYGRFKDKVNQDKMFKELEAIEKK